MKRKLLVNLKKMDYLWKKKASVLTVVLGIIGVFLIFCLEKNYNSKTLETRQAIAYGGIVAEEQPSFRELSTLMWGQREQTPEVILTNRELAGDTLLGTESLPNKKGSSYTIYDSLEFLYSMPKSREKDYSFQRIQQQNVEIMEQQKVENKVRTKKKTAIVPNKEKISLTNKEKDILLRIVEAEAGGEDLRGRMLVANVVLNRVNCETEFPDNVEQVVFDCSNGVYQFSPILDGRYWEVEISEQTREAVSRVLAGEDSSQGALYFMARKYADRDNVKWFDDSLTWLFGHGCHEFFK